MDVFSWSLPFVAEKVIEMFFHVLKTTKDEDNISAEDLEDVDLAMLTQEEKSSKIEEKKEIMRNKVKFVSKLLKMQKTLRQHSETIIQIKNKYNKLPKGLLLEGEEGKPIFFIEPHCHLQALNLVKRLTFSLFPDFGLISFLALNAFKKARVDDMKNEKRPD